MTPFINKSKLKSYYTIFLEVGLIITLLSAIALTKLPIKGSQGTEIQLPDQKEVITMEEIEQTKQEERVPPPPRPQVPVVVPNDEIIEDEILDIDAELNIYESIELPPTPPRQIEQEGEDEEDFFIAVEEMPELIGGIQALQQKIRYPERARMAGIEGRVIVQFIVTEKGEVENPQVIRGIGGGCDEEALRVISQAKFKPGRQRDIPVRVRYTLPIIFKLQ